MNRTIRLSVRAILRAATRLITRRVPRTARAGCRDLYFRARTSVTVRETRRGDSRARSLLRGDPFNPQGPDVECHVV